MKLKKAQNQRKRQSPKSEDKALPLVEHLNELRRRIIFSVASIAVVAIGAYFVQQHIVNLLLWPAHGQQFIYTNVGGGISFLFKLCMYVGLAVCMPVIVYHLLRYLQPLLESQSNRFILLACLACGIFAAAGMAFGYFIGLPAALHFLLHQFTTKQIHPLLTIQEYLSFVIAYMFGSALLFQIPLILLFINRFKPLKPSRLWHYERWVILGAFIVSGLMNPTPEIVSQLALAGPIILMYQLGILVIWYVNRKQNLTLAEDVSVIESSIQSVSATEQLVSLTSLSQPMVSKRPASRRQMVMDIGPLPIEHLAKAEAVITKPAEQRRQPFMDIRPPMQRVVE